MLAQDIDIFEENFEEKKPKKNSITIDIQKD